MKQENLENKLKIYSQSGVYPFHMPGHKRLINHLENPYALDITEINGFDNLHKPEGILLRAKENLAKLYGAKESFFLVNGSTCGLLAAISAATKRGDRILLARNCHKAVYHAASLRGLYTEYLYPAITKEGIQGSICPKDVEKILEEKPDIRTVVLTSPSYDGILSDIRSIAEIVHKKRISLIVDEAHGAHLGFLEGFLESAVSQGADVVIQSFHKTLPSFTQTAVLHRNSDRVSGKKVQKYLSIFQTSSPSYLLMASIDSCVEMLAEEKEKYFSNFLEKLKQFYEKVKKLNVLKVLTEQDFLKKEVYSKDPSKILIYTGNTNITGVELVHQLREQWKLELEMSSGYYALAMSSIMDTREGFFRLEEALLSIDQKMQTAEKEQSFSFMKELYGKKETIFPIWEAEEMEGKEISIAQAEGEVTLDTIMLYPPGIPLLLPGEKIEFGFLNKIQHCKEMGLNLCGLSGELNERINVATSSQLYYTNRDL
ncbi:MAG: aminotransferase class I/II-fold pyridoxal phosphate-dependent enzyme [Lachnospiraceae bacterium]|nr:aminotransferase class I/II-fold pyridoxal phosphate-dependent enzyme [Lachnospiraceae bacterium]